MPIILILNNFWSHIFDIIFCLTSNLYVKNTVVGHLQDRQYRR